MPTAITILIILLSVSLCGFAVANNLTTQDISSNSTSRLPQKAIFEKMGIIYTYSLSTNKITPLADDGNKKYIPRLAPNKNYVAFAYAKDYDKFNMLKVGILNLKTNEIKDIIIDNTFTNEIMDIQWVGNNSIGVEGHISPHIAEYFTYKVDDGSLIKRCQGSLFNSLKDGKSIVYKKSGSPYDDNAEIDTVYIDDTPVYRADNIDTKIEDIQVSPNISKLLIVEKDNKNNKNFVVTADLDASKNLISKSQKASVNTAKNKRLLLLFDEEDNVFLENGIKSTKLNKEKGTWEDISSPIDSKMIEESKKNWEKLNTSLKEYFKNVDNNDIVYVSSIFWFD